MTREKHASTRADEANTEARGSLSELLARILDQLSVSAWLPAAVLVAGLLLLASLSTHDNQLGPALTSIGHLKLNSTVLLIGAVVIMTVITQAFEFEAIRLLEGYWGASWLATALGGILCRRHLNRRGRLELRLERLQRKLFPQVRQLMLERDVTQAVVNIIEAKQTGQPPTGTDNDLAEADSILWLDHAPPQHRRRYDALSDALDEFPSEPLTLPTRLGESASPPTFAHG